MFWMRILSNWTNALIDVAFETKAANLEDMAEFALFRYILGSMEFACKVSGSKLILILGHEHCGAVKAAVDDVKLGNITPMLAKIRPVIESIEYDGDRTSKNQEFVHIASESNVRNTIEKSEEVVQFSKKWKRTERLKSWELFMIWTMEVLISSNK